MNPVRNLIAIAMVLVSLSLGSMVGKSSLGQADSRSGRNREVTPAQARDQIDLLAKDLREARSLTSRITDRPVREKMESLLAQAELRARDLSDDLGRAKPVEVAAPLSPADFDKLLAGLKKEAFDQGKLTYVENFATAKPLSSSQAAALTKCFSFDELRIKAAQALHPKLTDKQNFQEVLRTFAFESGRASARKAVGLK